MSVYDFPEDRRSVARELHDDLTLMVAESSLENKRDFLKKISGLYDLVVQQKLEIAALLEANSRESLQKLAAQEQAEVVKQIAINPPKPQKKKEDHILIVYPSNEETDPAELRSRITESIDPKEIKVTVTDVYPVKNGGIAIKTKTEGELEILEGAVNTAEGLKDTRTFAPKKRNPRIIVSGFPTGTSEEEVTSAIQEQHNIEVALQFSIPGKDQTHFVYEIAPRDFDKVKNAKVSIGWKTGSTSEFVRPSQCYKCYRLGHFAQNCTYSERCGHCSSKKHRADKCKKRIRKCHQCIRSNKTKGTHYKVDHTPRDLSCYIRTQEVKLMRKRINYG